MLVPDIRLGSLIQFMYFNVAPIIVLGSARFIIIVAFGCSAIYCETTAYPIATEATIDQKPNWAGQRPPSRCRRCIVIGFDAKGAGAEFDWDRKKWYVRPACAPRPA